MQRFTPISLLLLAATCSLTTAERATTCESRNNVHYLRCERGVISVKSSLYGRADATTCGEGRPSRQLSNTSCSRPGTADFVRRRCNGKKECEINIGDVQNPDPCRGIFKYLDTNYTCLPAIRHIACESSLAQLFCGEGQVIFVYGAHYGRQDRTTCAYRRPTKQTGNTLCFSPTNKVAQRCNGQNRCTVRASNSVFGDPCKGTYKYLEVAYTCEYPGVVPPEHYPPK